MLDRLAASTHRIRIPVQARLHGIDNVLVLSSQVKAGIDGCLIRDHQV
jgi:hypothetical protein